jgi:magnesium-dependent phosphatase 1
MPTANLVLILILIPISMAMAKLMIRSVYWKTLPHLVVFDLDMCFWSPEMYELDEIPTPSSIVTGDLGDGAEGCIAVKSGRELIRVFPDALKVLQDFHNGHFGNDMRIAAASSADTPRAVSIGRAALGLLEVVPGVTVRSVFARGWPEGFEGNLQIGRTPPLSSNKAATHFPLLKQHTGIAYDKMVFFDDCNWGDHCSAVEKGCPGVVAQRTPQGLQLREFTAALDRYEKKEASKR